MAEKKVVGDGVQESTVVEGSVADVVVVTENIGEKEKHKDLNLAEMFQKGEIDAIAIDTSIFDKEQLKLQSGRLAHLAQFKERGYPVLVSEINYRELKKHLVAKIQKGLESVRNSVSSIKDYVIRVLKIG